MGTPAVTKNRRENANRIGSRPSDTLTGWIKCAARGTASITNWSQYDACYQNSLKEVSSLDQHLNEGNDYCEPNPSSSPLYFRNGR
jgi:hypothetical protein